MHQAFIKVPTAKKIFSRIDVLSAFHENTCNVLQQIGDLLENKKHAKQKTITLPSIEVLRNSINTEVQSLSADEAEYLYAYLFGADIMVTQLNTLINLIKEIDAKIH